YDLRVGAAPGPSDLRALRDLMRLKDRFSPHVIHAHSSKAGGLARLLGMLCGQQNILYTPNAYYGMGNGGLKSWLFSCVERCLGTRGMTINVSGDEQRFGVDRLK